MKIIPSFLTRNVPQLFESISFLFASLTFAQASRDLDSISRSYYLDFKSVQKSETGKPQTQRFPCVAYETLCFVIRCVNPYRRRG